MIVLPVIARELRASARHAFTYNLRTLGVGALVLASFFFGVDYGFAPTMGGRLFGSLHFTLFCSIWVLVPLLTADCISRERREGTLGLLFLTALKASDIVIAKSFANGLRALTLWLAVLPVVTIPFLMGGLTASDALLSASINFSAICCSLAAGLVASSCSRTWLRALLCALILSMVFLLVLGAAVGFICWSLATPGSVGGAIWNSVSGGGFPILRGTRGELFERLDVTLLVGLGIVSNVASNWFSFIPLASVFRLAGGMAAFSLLILLLAVWAAGARTRVVWQEAPPSSRQVWLEKTFCTPVFWLSFFRRWMRRKLERNPVGWLEQRSWSGRLVTWGWFAVIISLYSAVLTDRNFFRGSNDAQLFMAWLLTGSLAMTAAASFRRERETGVLELLLVSPLAEGEIVKGRLRGLWAQFLPAFGALLGLWAYFLTFDLRQRSDAPIIWFYGITFLTLPIIGLYFSLRCQSFIGAFSWTCAIGALVPVVAPIFVPFAVYIAFHVVRMPFLPHSIGPSVWASMLQIVFAVLCWNWLHRRLRQRAFPLQRGDV